MRSRLVKSDEKFTIVFNKKQFSGETKSILMKQVKDELGFTKYHNRKKQIVLVF